MSLEVVWREGKVKTPVAQEGLDENIPHPLLGRGEVGRLDA
jgi:hypothetical protein